MLIIKRLRNKADPYSMSTLISEQATWSQDAASRCLGLAKFKVNLGISAKLESGSWTYFPYLLSSILRNSK